MTNYLIVQMSLHIHTLLTFPMFANFIAAKRAIHV